VLRWEIVRACFWLVALLTASSSCRFPAYRSGTGDACETEPCRNGGQCFSAGDDYTCECRAPFMGRDCESMAESQGGSGGMGAASGTGATGATAVAGGAAGTGGSAGISGSGAAAGEPSEPDDCPNDPNKLEPGECGCGVPDVGTAELADCHDIEDALLHRYDFEGTGTQVIDRVGDADGVIARGATLSKLDGKGVVLLGGGAAGAYVDLPNGILSELEDASLEAWVTWGGGSAWQRIFDFGDTTDPNPENHVGTGRSYLFLSPLSNDSTIELIFSSNGAGSPDRVSVEAGPPLSLELSQVVVVANSSDDELVLYVNGAKLAEESWTAELSLINDVNCWLGRSQWIDDPELTAIFHDFRIYDRALTDAQVAATFAGGPDASFLAD
jgi:hypothetical protein